MASAPPGTPRLVFGVSWQGGDDPRRGAAGQLVQWLRDRVDFRVSLRVALSYSELGEMVRTGGCDVAWVPPIVYVRLDRAKAVDPLLRVERLGMAGYHAALIVHIDSPIDSIESMFGTVAAWVDRHSAAGFVIPRAVLAARGLHPESVFREERFYGSHDAVVRAVVSGRAHVGGTYARLDPQGRLMPGNWSHIPGAEGRLRALMTFGAIPGDVIVVRKGFDPKLQERFADALIAAAQDPEASKLVKEVMGANRFTKGPPEGYELFRDAVID